jgi:hypothetical protein
MADVKRSLLSHLPVVIAALVALIAAGAWWIAWRAPDEPERSAETSRPVEGKTKTADGLPPMRALPPPGTDLRPPLRTPPPETPDAPPAQQAAAPPASAPAPGPVKVAPALPVTPKAPQAEKAASAAPPAQAAKRPEAAADSTSGALAGRYVGNISGTDGGGLTLTISGVQGGAVKATAALTAGGVCDDNYPMQGSMRSGRLELRATQMGGRANDCPLSLSLTVDGNRMTGSTGGGGSVQLTKR